MARTTVEWDDFRGGYWVGGSDANQPRNTWRGHDVVADTWSGALTPRSFTTFSNTGTPTDTDASSSSYLFTTGDTVYRIYLTTTANLINCCRYVPGTSPPSSPLTVTNTTVTTTGMTLWSAAAWNDDYIFVSYQPSAGANTLTRINVAASPPTMTSYTGPVAETSGIRCLARWGEFMVGAGFLTSYRLYYSNAYDPTTWGASNYYDIGDSSQISAIIPVGDTLYVAKPEGWYVITGVLGTSTTIRRIAPGVAGVAAGGFGVSFSMFNGPGVVETPLGLMYSTREHSASVLNGNVFTPINYQPPNGIPQEITPGLYGCGGGVDGFGNVNSLHIYGASQNQTLVWVMDASVSPPRWSRHLVPYTTAVQVAQNSFARLLPGWPARRYLWVDTASETLAFMNYEKIGTGTATVHLAEYRTTDPMTPRQINVEIMWTASATTPSVTARLECRGFADLPDPGRIGTTVMGGTQTARTSAPATALSYDRPYVHQVLRFPIDGPACTSMVPILTFSNCMIRRVWVNADTIPGAV